MKKKKEEIVLKNKSVDLKLSFVSLLTKENGVLTAIVLLTIIIFSHILNNEFLNWDDDTYIQNNPLIFSFHIKEYFSQFFTGNYHPLTLFILAIEYSFFGLKETGYHAFNLFLHLLNVILVYRIISILEGKKEVALIACLFFALKIQRRWTGRARWSPRQTARCR